MKKHDITAGEIQKKLEKQGVEISTRTVRRRLGESGGKFLKEIQKPYFLKSIKQNDCSGQKNIKILTGKKLFLLMKVPFNYFSQIERSGGSLGDKKCFVWSSIHKRFTCGVVFLLQDLVS
jgi:hypothetical protein